MNQVKEPVGARDRIESILPQHRDLYYDGAWRKPTGGYQETLNPATGKSLGPCAEANAQDVDAAVTAAHRAYKSWRAVKPLERAALMKKVAARLRENAEELAMLDAANCGNPVREMVRDAGTAAAQWEFFAGLVTELKGHTSRWATASSTSRCASPSASARASSPTTTRSCSPRPRRPPRSPPATP